MRENRIDIIRGIALLFIVVNHLTYSLRELGLRGPEVPSPSAFGYSSSAEIFVALSGYMVGLVYWRRPSPELATLKRAGKLYFVNFIVLAAISPLAFMGAAKIQQTTGLANLSDSPFRSLLRFATLTYTPRYLDVLRLYIELLAMTPVAIFIANKSRSLLVGISSAVYLYAVVEMHPSPQPDHYNKAWIFNPLAWQFLFFTFML